MTDAPDRGQGDAKAFARPDLPNNLDINLMSVFAVVFETASASRAAERLGISQSAVSHSLKRLRVLLGDRLFVRDPHGLAPTSYARHIAPGVIEGISLLRAAVAPRDYVPSRETRTFVIAAPAHLSVSLLAPLAERIAAAAPGVRLHVRTVDDSVFDAMPRGAVDLAIVEHLQVPNGFESRQLPADPLVWVSPARARNPLPGRSAKAPMTISLSGGRSSGGNDAAATLSGPSTGHDAASVIRWQIEDPMTAADVLERTGSSGLMPLRLARSLQMSGRFHLIERAREGTAPPATLVWRKARATEPAIAWLIQLLCELASAGATDSLIGRSRRRSAIRH